MKERILAIGSVTYATKARHALRAEKIPCRVTRTDSEGDRGCIYGLAIPEQHFMKATEILRRLGIQYRTDYGRNV